MPIGAINVALCFSAANMNTVKTNSVVRNISINNPCGMDVPPDDFVPTVNGAGNKHETIAAAMMPPRIWTVMRSAPLTQESPPMRHKPSVTREKFNIILKTKEI